MNKYDTVREIIKWRYLGTVFLSKEDETQIIAKISRDSLSAPVCTRCILSKEKLIGVDTNWMSCPSGHQWYVPNYFSKNTRQDT